MDTDSGKVSQGVRNAFWFRGMQGGLKNQFECLKAFFESNFTEDLKKFDVPILISHGDDDQIAPIGASARAVAKLVKKATQKIYPHVLMRPGRHTRRPTQRRPAGIPFDPKSLCRRLTGDTATADCSSVIGFPLLFSF